MAFYLGNLSPSNKMIDSDGKIRNMSFDTTTPAVRGGVVNGRSVIAGSTPLTHTDIRSGWQLHRTATSTQTDTIATHTIQLPDLYEYGGNNQHRYDIVHIVAKGFTTSEISTQYPIFQFSNSLGTFQTNADYHNYGISGLQGDVSTGQWSSTSQTHGWLVKPQWSPFGVTGGDFSFEQTIFLNDSQTGEIRVITKAGFMQGSGSTVQRMITGTTVTIYGGMDTGFGPPKYIRYREGPNPIAAGTSVLKYNVYTPNLMTTFELP